MDDTVAMQIERRWWDGVWRDGDLELIDVLFTEPFVRHSTAGSERTTRAAYKARMSDARRAISGAETTIDDFAVTGDRTWTRATTRGVNRETGELAIVSWLVEKRFEGDRIAEQWTTAVRDVEWRV